MIDVGNNDQIPNISATHKGSLGRENSPGKRFIVAIRFRSGQGPIGRLPRQKLTRRDTAVPRKGWCGTRKRGQTATLCRSRSDPFHVTSEFFGRKNPANDRWPDTLGLLLVARHRLSPSALTWPLFSSGATRGEIAGGLFLRSRLGFEPLPTLDLWGLKVLSFVGWKLSSGLLSLAGLPFAGYPIHQFLRIGRLRAAARRSLTPVPRELSRRWIGGPLSVSFVERDLQDGTVSRLTDCRLGAIVIGRLA